MLSFAAIRGQLHGLAVGPVKGPVNVQNGLDRVVSGRHILQTRPWIALRVGSDCEGFTRLPSVDRYTENHLRLNRVVDLHSRLGARVVRKQKKQPPVQRLIGARGRKGRRYRLSGGSCSQRENEKNEAHTGVYAF